MVLSSKVKLGLLSFRYLVVTVRTSIVLEGAAPQSSSAVQNAIGSSTSKVPCEKAFPFKSGRQQHGLHSITAPIIPAAFQNPPQKPR